LSWLDDILITPLIYIYIYTSVCTYILDRPNYMACMYTHVTCTCSDTIDSSLQISADMQRCSYTICKYACPPLDLCKSSKTYDAWHFIPQIGKLRTRSIKESNSSFKTYFVISAGTSFEVLASS